MVSACGKHAPGWGKWKQNQKTPSERGHHSEREMFSGQQRLSSPGGSVQEGAKKALFRELVPLSSDEVLSRWATA